MKVVKMNWRKVDVPKLIFRPIKGLYKRRPVICARALVNWWLLKKTGYLWPLIVCVAWTICSIFVGNNIWCWGKRLCLLSLSHLSNKKIPQRNCGKFYGNFLYFYCVLSIFFIMNSVYRLKTKYKDKYLFYKIKYSNLVGIYVAVL